MTDLSVNNKFLSLSTFKETLIISFEGCNEVSLNRTEEVAIKDNKGEPDDNYDGCVPVVSSAFSSCQQLFVCCAHKDLSVWNVTDWTLLAKKNIQRSASKVIFSPKNDCVIVADKSGDVYLHYLDRFEKPGDLILGHVSMLLDVLVTPDEKYIITCDRDEKIRVSHYPNAYNIQCYCLGHEEFVTSLCLLPNQSKLLSVGGDGTLRVWDYVSGNELFSYSVSDDVSKVKTLEESRPVVYKVSVLKFDDDSTLICSLIFKTNAIWLYNINHAETMTLSFSQVIKTESEPYCLQTLRTKQQLWFLQLDAAKPLLGFTLIDNQLVQCEDIVSIIQDIIKKQINVVELNKLYERQITSLCKKKFDNESDYYKRKNERLEADRVKRLAKAQV